MNCQDISRIADVARINGLNAAERRAAETHVLTCRSCAAVWGVNARLAELQVPQMPTELRHRCRTLAMLPEQARIASSPRRPILVGSLLAILAAAAILMMYTQFVQAPGFGPTAAAIPVESRGDATPTQFHVDAAPAPATLAATEQTTTLHVALPRLPRPVEPDKRAVEDLALQKLVERHPELVEGPDLEAPSSFMAVMAMRPEGEVISSAVRISSGMNAYELDHELWRTLPTDGGATFITSRQKHTIVPDGRSLRGNLLNFRIVVVPTEYNASRSTNRVREILGNRYDHLLLPSEAGIGMLNRLTILLAADGSILKEQVELESQKITNTVTRADDPKDVARVAEDRAKRLGVDVAQIGLMGSTSIEVGTIKLVDNGTPGGFVDDKRRQLMVSYVWKRGGKESAPRLRQDGVQKPAVDLASALTIVEQEIPDAFTRVTVGAETLLVVMAADGTFLRAGRVQMLVGAVMTARQLVPGVNTTSFTTVRLTNKDGATADVRFVWEVP